MKIHPRAKPIYTNHYSYTSIAKQTDFIILALETLAICQMLTIECTRQTWSQLMQSLQSKG